MERTDILALMGELKLYGMRAAWPEGRIAWGVNAPGTGVNVLRGIRRPDGSDEPVT